MSCTNLHVPLYDMNLSDEEGRIAHAFDALVHDQQQLGEGKD